VDCFYQDDVMLYIHPDECIYCGACIDECPVDAIYFEGEVPTQWHPWVALNRERATALRDAGGNIKERQEPKLGPGCKPA
jgi:ferredoxin